MGTPAGIRLKYLLSIFAFILSYYIAFSSENPEPFFSKGRKAYSNYEYETSIRLFNKALHHNTKLYGRESVITGETLVFLGRNYSKLHIYNRAVEYFEKAEKIYSSHIETSPLIMAMIAGSLAAQYYKIGDYNKALSQLDNLQRIVASNNIQNLRIKENIYKSYAHIFSVTGKYDLALGNIGKSLKINSSIVNQLDKLNIKGTIYYEMGDYKNSLLFFNRALKIGNREFGTIYPDKYLFLTNIANIYSKQEEYDKAIKYDKEALSIVNKLFGKKDPAYSLILNNIGTSILRKAYNVTVKKERKQTIQLSLRTFQQSLISLIPGFSSSNLKDNHVASTSSNSLLLIDILLGKSDALKELAKVEKTLNNSNEEVENFKISLTTYELAIELINKTRNSYQSEESMMVLSENMGEAYFEACEVAVMLYEATGDKEYLNKAFQFSEKGKSSSFLASLRGVEAMEFGGIPDSLLQKEKELKQDIAIRDEFILNEKQYDADDGEKINQWESEVFELEKEYSVLIKYYEEEFPEYYSFKYSDAVISIEEVQKSLPGDQSLVEYVIKEPEDGDAGEIITFVISKDSYFVNQTKIDSTFFLHIEKFVYSLKGVDPLDITVADFAEYAEVAHALYKKLVEPVKSSITTDRIVFIQEGSLINLPMEVLLSSMPDTSDIHFQDLDYLINDYAVSYSYSATLLYDYFSPKEKAGETFLGLAPEYNSEEIIINHNVGHRGILYPLKAAKVEVEKVSEMVNGKAVTGNRVYAKDFKSDASRYDILHLSMHTAINDNLPMYSKLIFNTNSDSTASGWINTYEIYNMKFNARMAVLSACNSGSGYIYKSEGAMSLARAFMYSGCQSVVMTLWGIADISAAAIMINFYHNLKKGKTKDVALREAKLNYIHSLKRPINAHPAYWQAFVTIGNQSALFYDFTSYITIALLTIVGIALLLAFRFKRQ